jgi:glutathione S-transferase
MAITITAFERSPDGGKGLARDTRVRWALEEVGQPYEVRLVPFRAMKEPEHLALHPVGQIPTCEEGDLVLFESGAIVLHIAQGRAGLLPGDAGARGPRGRNELPGFSATTSAPPSNGWTTWAAESLKPWRGAAVRDCTGP